MCSCSHSTPSKAGKRARERRRLPEDQALGRWGSLGVEGLREGLGHLGWACRMAERQTGHRDTQKYRYSRERRNGARGWGDGDLWGWGVQRGEMPVQSTGKDALARAAAQRGRPATKGDSASRLEAWLQGRPWSSMSLYLIRSLLGWEGTG